ncbi:MAG: glycosyltransferase family 4 protein [Anaerolineaceae bacterium]|nr:glycosyltransferase family 4 protein [Anaerolineaceae bacterium]
MDTEKHLPKKLRKHRVGFISVRFKGTDGVSLETEKWVAVLEKIGCDCFFFAGESDWETGKTQVVPEACFYHPEIGLIHEKVFSQRTRPRELTDQIQDYKDYLKARIYEFIDRFNIDLIIVENALAIPLHIPLGLAITEFIAETGFRTIAHHHDFFWERTRFLSNCVWDYLNMAFPPRLPSIQHVVINSSGGNQLALRTGASSTLIPNVMDFDNPPDERDDYTKNIRQDLCVADDELLFLQPTRVVQRKGIEHAIELISRLNRKARLVISHASGDEGYEYEQRLRDYAKLMNVPVNFEADIIDDDRGTTRDGRKIYSVWDAYPAADIVTYPSTFEGFGNAFLETIYFKRPIIVNNYSIYFFDIKPKDFNVVEFDGFISDETVDQVKKILDTPLYTKEIVEKNYEIAKRFYSFSVLERKLNNILSNFFGENGENLI